MVHLENPAAKLADAAEELSFGESERMESRLAKRRIASEKGASTLAAELAEQYLRQIPDLQQEDLDDFNERLQRLGKTDPQTMRRLAQQRFDDASHQFAALSWARDKLQAEGGDPEVITALQEACDQLMAEAGPAVQAGLNVSTTAHDFAAKGLGGTGELRGLYRDLVLDYSSMEQAWDKIATDFPDRQFKDAVSYLRQALAADLSSANQSQSPERLKQTIDDLDKLKTLLTLYDKCEDLLTRTTNNYGALTENTSTPDLMKQLLIAQNSRWLGSDAFAALPAKLGVADGEPGIYFLQGFRQLVRQAPMKVFDEDSTKRDRLMQALQAALDTLIDNEEEVGD